MISKFADRHCLIGLGLVALLLSGCANIYEENLFADFDGPPSVSELENSSASRIAEAAESPQFYADLRRNRDARNRIQQRLRTIYRDGNSSDSDVRVAASLSASIEIETTNGAAVVNNVVDVFLEEGTDGDFSDPGTLARSIFPPSVRSNPDALAEQIRSFNEAADAYQAYGNGLNEENQPADTNSGEVAQRAAVSVLVSELARQAGDGDPEAGASVLARDISEDRDDSYDNYSDPTENTLGDQDNPTPLRSILDVAGLTGVVEGSE